MPVRARSDVEVPSTTKSKKPTLSDRKADAALAGLATKAEQQQWDNDVQFVVESMRKDRDLSLSLVGSVSRWEKKEKTARSSVGTRQKYIR